MFLRTPLRISFIRTFVAVTHRPPPSVCGHVAVHLEAGGMVQREHGVDAVLSLTAGEQVTAVTGTRA